MLDCLQMELPSEVRADCMLDCLPDCLQMELPSEVRDLDAELTPCSHPYSPLPYPDSAPPSLPN